MFPVERADEAVHNGSTDVANSGPPSALPEQVPGFVDDIVETIDELGVPGSERLGELIAEIASSVDVTTVGSAAAEVAALL